MRSSDSVDELDRPARPHARAQVVEQVEERARRAAARRRRSSLALEVSARSASAAVGARRPPPASTRDAHLVAEPAARHVEDAQERRGVARVHRERAGRRACPSPRCARRTTRRRRARSGTPRWRNSVSSARDWAFVRYSTAQSASAAGRARAPGAPRGRRARPRPARRARAGAGAGAGRRRASLHSVLPLRARLCAITAFAAAQDVARRAVVLLQADDLGARERGARSRARSARSAPRQP